MRWNREEYIAHCKGEYVGKEMFCELFRPMIGLKEEWAAQGATESERALTAFGWDYVPHPFAAANAGPISGIEPHVVEETADFTDAVDHYGRRTRLSKKKATLALPMDFPVRTMDDWLRIKHWYAFDEKRINMEELLHQKKLQQEGQLVLFGVPGGFDEPRQLMGEEALCIAAYDEPELIEDMLATMADTACKVMERVGAVLTIDDLHIHEDMAGKGGPLFGPKQVTGLLRPYYRKVWECAQAQGAQIFSQDSDGDMDPVVDAFIDCGINLFYPCEPAAGMDMVRLRKKYGRSIAVKGGIDKHVLRTTKEAIRAELEYKMSPEMQGGGIVFALDHLIPNGVPIENYRYYVQLGRELLGLPAAKDEGIFVSMAF